MGGVGSFEAYVVEGSWCGVEFLLGVLTVEKLVGLVVCVVMCWVLFGFVLCDGGGCSRCIEEGSFVLFCMTSVCFFR